MTISSRTLVVVSGILLFAAAAGAQFAPPPLELRFANPGARSTGFGGAFVALADDATAAFSNPAGLTQLNRMEISAEIRAEIEAEASRSSNSVVGFSSFVYPRKNFSLAVYRSQLADFDVRTMSVGPVVGDVLPLFLGSARLEVEVIGFSGSYRVKEGLSFGLGVASFTTSLSGTFDEFIFDLRDFSPQEELVRRVILNGESTDVGLLAGVLWDFAPSWRLGGFYRQGPRLEVDFRGSFFPASGLPLPPEVFARETISFPDTFGLGIAWKTLKDRLTASFEWDRVQYSSVLDSLDPRLFDKASAALDDGDELHVGVEYVVASKPAVALRLGAWHEEDHRLRRLDAAGRPVAAGGGDVGHLNGGLGIAFRKLQIDLGFDASDFTDLVSLSLIYSF